jgi:hypothetical protein
VSSLDELRASLLQAINRIEEAQSSAGVTRDRGDEALRLTGAVTDGSDSPLVATAIENVAAADAALEEVLGMYVVAAEQIRIYMAQKNL